MNLPFVVLLGNGSGDWASATFVDREIFVIFKFGRLKPEILTPEPNISERMVSFESERSCSGMLIAVIIVVIKEESPNLMLQIQNQ